MADAKIDLEKLPEGLVEFLCGYTGQKPEQLAEQTVGQLFGTFVAAKVFYHHGINGDQLAATLDVIRAAAKPRTRRAGAVQRITGA